MQRRLWRKEKGLDGKLFERSSHHLLTGMNSLASFFVVVVVVVTTVPTFDDHEERDDKTNGRCIEHTFGKPPRKRGDKKVGERFGVCIQGEYA